MTEFKLALKDHNLRDSESTYCINVSLENTEKAKKSYKSLRTTNGPTNCGRDKVTFGWESEREEGMEVFIVSRKTVYVLLSCSFYYTCTYFIPSFLVLPYLKA